MRYLFHLVVSILMWILFGYYWYVVIRRQINIDSYEAVGLLALISLVGLLGTVWWVAHNRRLASRNRRLQPPPTQPLVWDRDALGRLRSGAPVEELCVARVIDVTLDAEQRKLSVTAVGGGR